MAPTREAPPGDAASPGPPAAPSGGAADKMEGAPHPSRADTPPAPSSPPPSTIATLERRDELALPAAASLPQPLGIAGPQPPARP
ncbi:MAG TPA: hypothetical protein VJ779_07405, partial [Acetobacteraceae bacterium]|nr:hypothetical protein [Acetobacteraceae bacterium]